MAIAPFANFPQSLLANGAPLNGGTIEFYESGTSTPAEVYDEDGASLGDTVTLDARGEPQSATGKIIFGDSAVTYKAILKDADGATIWTRDPVYPIAVAGVTNQQWVNATSATYVSSTSFTVSGTPTADDGTKIWHVGRQVRVYLESTDAYRYGTISSVSEATDTTVTLTDITDSSGTSATISNEELTVWVGVNSAGAESAAVNFYALSSQEDTNGITPSNWTYKWGDSRRYQSIQDALDSGHEVFIEGGEGETYTITSPLTYNKNGGVIRSNGAEITGDDLADYLLTCGEGATRRGQLKVDGLKFNPTGTTPGGLKVVNMENVRVDGVRVTNFETAGSNPIGIAFLGTWNSRIVNPELHGNLSKGVLIDQDPTSGNRSNIVQVTDGYFHLNGTPGSPSTGHDSSAIGLHVAEGYGVLSLNNDYEQCAGHGIKVDSSAINQGFVSICDVFEKNGTLGLIEANQSRILHSFVQPGNTNDFVINAQNCEFVRHGQKNTASGNGVILDTSSSRCRVISHFPQGITDNGTDNWIEGWDGSNSKYLEYNAGSVMHVNADHFWGTDDPTTDFIGQGAGGTKGVQIDPDEGRIFQYASDFHRYANIDYASGTVIIDRFRANGVNAGSIDYDGVNVGFNTTSDRRIKKILGPTEGAADRVASIPVHWGQIQGESGYSSPRTILIADEVAVTHDYVVKGEPNATYQEKDGVVRPLYQEVNYPGLIPDMLAAISELVRRVRKLEDENGEE